MTPGELGRSFGLGLVHRLVRHRAYVAVVGVIIVVAGFFPGEDSARRGFVPSAGFGGTALDDTADTGDTGDEQAAQVLGATTSASGLVVGGPAGAFESPPPTSPFAPAPHGPPDEQPPSSPPPGPGGGAPPPEEQCAVPGIDQAREAQAALETRIGRPFPVDLVGTVSNGVCGGSGGASSDVLVLGGLVPLHDTELLGLLAPVIDEGCRATRQAAFATALSGSALPSALADALLLCRAAS